MNWQIIEASNLKTKNNITYGIISFFTLWNYQPIHLAKTKILCLATLRKEIIFLKTENKATSLFLNMYLSIIFRYDSCSTLHPFLSYPHRDHSLVFFSIKCFINRRISSMGILFLNCNSMLWINYSSALKKILASILRGKGTKRITWIPNHFWAPAGWYIWVYTFFL